MGECEKVGKMRFYPKPAGWPEFQHRIVRDCILVNTSPFSSPSEPRRHARAAVRAVARAAIEPAFPRACPARGTRSINRPAL